MVCLRIFAHENSTLNMPLSCHPKFSWGKSFFRNEVQLDRKLPICQKSQKLTISGQIKKTNKSTALSDYKVFEIFVKRKHRSIFKSWEKWVNIKLFWFITSENSIIFSKKINIENFL